MRQRENINYIYDLNFLIFFFRNSQIVPGCVSGYLYLWLEDVQ